MPYTTHQKAKTIVHAAVTTDRQAAKDMDVSRRSVIRWRDKMSTDPKLAQAVAKVWKEYRDADTWVDDATHTIRKAQAFIRDATDALNPSDPESVHAVTEALSTLVEATQMARIIDARLADQNPDDGAAGEQDVAGYIGSAAS